MTNKNSLPAKIIIHAVFIIFSLLYHPPFFLSYPLREKREQILICLLSLCIYFLLLFSIAFAMAITAGNNTAAITQTIHPSFQLSVGRLNDR